MTRSVAAQSASDAISGLKIGVFAARHFVAPAAMEQPDALAVADAIIQIACETTDAKTAERLMARAVALFEEAGLPPDYDPETEPGYLLH